MAREIKYRGKRADNGQWACGYPMKNEFTEKWYIFPPQGLTGTTGVEVDQTTLGQYTGLKDKNGKEIYEGDIIIFPRSNDRHKRKGIVDWCPEKARFIVRKANSRANYYHTLKMIPDCEVVGNVHEPEPSKE